MSGTFVDLQSFCAFEMCAVRRHLKSILVFCVVSENICTSPSPPLTEGIGNFRGWGWTQMSKSLKKCMKQIGFFTGGGGVIKNPFCGVVGMDYFSRTAYCEFCP